MILKANFKYMTYWVKTIASKVKWKELNIITKDLLKIKSKNKTQQFVKFILIPLRKMRREEI